MSDRSDIRMHVEHLFEGRMLDAETIELKEEIYGNLVARYDDYVAQGMSADEAYRRTCEAVTSIEDVLGEKDEPAAAEAPTRAMPRPEPKPGPQPGPVPPRPAAPEPPAGVTPPAPAPAAPKRWSAGMIVAVVAVVLLVAGIAGCTVFNMLDTQRAHDDYQGQTSQTVQQVDEPGTTSESSGQTTSQTTGNGADTSQQTTGGQTTGAPEDSADDLSDDIYAVTPETLSGQTALSTASPDQGALTTLVQTLPLGTYLGGVSVPSAGTLEVTYSYPTHDERNYIARDDDYVDRALVFNAAALICTVSDLDTLTVYETEPDDDSPYTDTDVHVFTRSDMEQVLGVTLDASQLTEGNWATLRDQLMEKRVWDRIWDRADRD